MFQPGDDPFGSITVDPIATADADNVVLFVKRSLGDDVINVELTAKEIYTNFEQAIHRFSAVVNEYYGKSNIADFLGTATGTLDSVTGQLPIASMGWQLLDAQQFAAESGAGGNIQTYLGSFTTAVGQQNYDLPTVLSQSWFDAYGQNPTGRVRIMDLYHLDPWDEYASSNGIDWYGGFGYFGGGVPAAQSTYFTQYQILPIFDSVVRRTNFKQAKRVRLSHYSFNVLGNELILYPTPATAHNLWIRWRKALDPWVDGVSGTVGGGLYGDAAAATIIPGSVSSIANMPLGLLQYGKVNQLGKSWIWNYTLALSKITLGYTRGKVTSGYPYPGGTTLTLDGPEQRSEGRADIERYETELRTELDKLTYDKIALAEADQAEQLNRKLQYVPLGIYVK